MSFLRLGRLTNVRFRSASTQSNSNPRTRFFRNASLATALSLTAYTFGTIYPPRSLSLIYSPPAPGPPPPDHPSNAAYTASLEATLQSLPIVRTLRTTPDADEWYETRPYTGFPEERRVNNLTAGALRGPGKLALAPLVRARKDEKESVVILHIGRGLCGHDGIVHGGMLATLLDEIMGRTAIYNLPGKIGVTANLSIDYRAPTLADQFVVFRTRLVSQTGRKALVEGTAETLSGEPLANASGLYVQPKYAPTMLNAEVIRLAMGVPERESK